MLIFLFWEAPLIMANCETVNRNSFGVKIKQKLIWREDYKLQHLEVRENEYCGRCKSFESQEGGAEG